MHCAICKRAVDKPYKHHVVPKAKGGAKKGVIQCCRTCSRQVHMLFSEKELSKMTLDELLETDNMQKYVQWIHRKKGEYRVRKSKRLRKG
jgi:hypothetical protein